MIIPLDILNSGLFRPEVVGRWFAKNDVFDTKIRENFVKHMLELKNDHSALAELQSDDQGLLASIILFDQFPRNAYRGLPDSFAFDSIALTAAKQLVKTNAYKYLHPAAQCFVFLVYFLLVYSDCMLAFRAFRKHRASEKISGTIPRAGCLTEG